MNEHIPKDLIAAFEQYFEMQSRYVLLKRRSAPEEQLRIAAQNRDAARAAFDKLMEVEQPTKEK